NFDRLYPGGLYPLAGWCGWAWTAVINSVGDIVGHAAKPINWQIPDNGASVEDVWDRLSNWGSFHVGGVNFCLGDGSVSYWADGTDLKIVQAAATIRGSESVTLP